MCSVRISPNARAVPAGKLADAELHFTGAGCADLAIIENVLRQLHDDSGKLRDERIEAARAALRRAREQQHLLDGLKLVGFSIWARSGSGYQVTFPARQYSVNGERRSFALLRPIGDTDGQERVRQLILAAFDDFERPAPEAL